MDIELFKQRLIETATWCYQYSKVEDRLRSPTLQPHFPQEARREGTYRSEMYLFELNGQKAQKLVIENVAHRRAHLLQSNHSKTVSLLEALSWGRLLAYTPTWTLWDGASEADTDGFYDLGDTPPWDTWVYCLEEKVGIYLVTYLIVWIPSDYISIADDGAQVTCGHCLEWLDEIDTDFVRQLRIEALL